MWFSILLFATVASAGGPTTLEQICGPANQIRPGQVLSEKCQAAYLAGNASLVQNNNTYVHGAAAVVCGYSCMAGGFNSCGGGGNACSAAVALGNKAYADDQGSARSFDAAQRNGSDAFAIVAGPNKDLMHGPGELATSVPPPPAPCASASKNRSVSARIACAAATDPSLPAFVGTAQFAADFQKITGYTLQDTFYQDGPTLLKDYAPNALNHAFGQARGKISFEKFVKAGMGIMNGIMGSLDPSERDGFVASVIPGPFRGLGMPAKPVEKPATQVAQVEAAAPVGTAPNPPTEPARLTAAAALPDPATEDEENKLGLSIFERVSLGYRRAFNVGKI